MTASKLAQIIALKEGKKSQARIGDIREIIKIIQTLLKEEIKAYPETNSTEILNVLFLKAAKQMEKDIIKKLKIMAAEGIKQGKKDAT